MTRKDENHFLVFYLKKILHMLWNSITAQNNSKQTSKIPSHMKYNSIKISVIPKNANRKEHEVRKIIVRH